MSSHAPSRLMFDWAQDHRRRLALWIVIALILHAGAYFLFRIAQPPAVPGPVLDTAIHVFPPDSPDAARLARFIAANDPSVVAPDRIGPISIPDPAIPPYRPSYQTAPPPLAPLPDPAPRLLPPVIRDFGPVPMQAERSSLVIPPPATATQLEFSGALSTRNLVSVPKSDFTARPGDHLAPAKFLLRVDADGRVLHVFEQQGSGNRALDEAAARHLAGARFDEANGPAWGVATFHWGADLHREELE